MNTAITALPEYAEIDFEKNVAKDIKSNPKS
jgi:hypothetical protein